MFANSWSDCGTVYTAGVTPCQAKSNGKKNGDAVSEASRSTWYTTYFPTCQVRVVRFYVSCLPFLLLPLLLLLFFFLLLPPSPPSFSLSYCDDVCVAMMCVQYCVQDLNCHHVRSVWRARPPPRSCAASVACRTSTAIMWGQCGVPDRMSERMSKDMSERMSDRMPERLSERMSERMSDRMSERMSKDMSERM